MISTEQKQINDKTNRLTDTQEVLYQEEFKRADKAERKEKEEKSKGK